MTMSESADSSPGPGDEGTIGKLGAAARRQREVLAQVRGTPTPEEVRAVETTLWPARRPVWPWLAAAAALLLGFALWRFAPGGEEPVEREPGIHLGGKELRVLAPVEACAGFSHVRWASGANDSIRFEVRVFDEESGELLLRVTELKGRELALDPGDTQAWRRIRVEVDELDSSGSAARSARSRAWRSP